MSIDLEAIETRANAASEGPWEPINKSVRIAGDYHETAPNGFSGGICNCIGNSYGASKDHWVNVQARNNADFIAHAREDVPALLAEVKRQAAEIATVTAERGALKDALFDMRFAYLNKDNPPHQFETDALEKANELLGPIGKEADHADN